MSSRRVAAVQTMHVRCFLVLLIILCPKAARTQGEAAVPKTVEVGGRLGVPLGKVVVLDAEILPPVPTKGGGDYVLNVTAVEGVPLREPVKIGFDECPGVSGFPRNPFELARHKNGRETGRLTAGQIEELEKGYVGRKVRVYAYESGGFGGIPKNMPRGFPVWQDRGFGFSTRLMILGEKSRVDRFGKAGE